MQSCIISLFTVIICKTQKEPQTWKMSHFLSTYRRRASPIVPVNHFSWACYLFLPVLLCVSSFAQRSHWPGLTSAEGIPWPVSVAAERCNLCLGLGVLEFEGSKSSGKDRLHGTGKEERRGPSSGWRLGMDDRGWLLCGNCLHKSCYEVSFLEHVCCCSYLYRTRTVWYSDRCFVFSHN